MESIYLSDVINAKDAYNKWFEHVTSRKYNYVRLVYSHDYYSAGYFIEFENIPIDNPYDNIIAEWKKGDPILNKNK